YFVEEVLSETKRQECYVESAELTQQLNADGQYLDAAPLQPISTATSVRVREGKRLVTHGPFPETRAQWGGSFMVKAKDLDEAINIAGRMPGAHFGTIEIRPVVEIPGLPE